MIPSGLGEEGSALGATQQSTAGPCFKGGPAVGNLCCTILNCIKTAQSPRRIGQIDRDTNRSLVFLPKLRRISCQSHLMCYHQ